MPKVSVEHEQMRRQQILDAALACFSRRGYHATSMEDIVREAGLSVGAIYTYFPSKEELFRVLAEARFRHTRDRIQAMVRQGDTLATRLESAIEHFFDVLDEEIGPWSRLLLEVRGQHGVSEGLAEREQERCREMRGWLEGILLDGVMAGECRADVDVGAVADLLVALSDGIVLNWVAGTLGADRERLKYAVKTLVCSGILTPSARIASDAAGASGPVRSEAALATGS